VSVTLRELARLVQGQLDGDGDLLINGARPLVEAQAGDITFVESPKQFSIWEGSPAAAAVVPHSSTLQGRPLIKVADSLVAFSQIVLSFRATRSPLSDRLIDPTAHIHPTVTIGEGCRIGPFAVIGEGAILGQNTVIHAHCTIGRFCQLGNDVTLFPNVVLYDDTRLGNRVSIHANSVIGSDGFGYRTHGGKHHKVQHLGFVDIADDVEIGACSSIDRGTFSATRIGHGTKIDNHVQIAHNCQIGPHNLLAAHVGIAGSVTTGAYVAMGGQVGIADHVQIGDGAMVAAQSGTASNLEAGKRYMGSPVLPMELHGRVLACLSRLPEMRRDVIRMKKHLGLDEASS
jgi:UDP-3-O-[3-hydroxymyristoyl] glucosamine N-acyltransferase